MFKRETAQTLNMSEREENMTFEDLLSVYSINIEIKKIQEEIQRLREQNFFKPNVISDMPRGGTGKDMLVEYAEESKRLDDMLNYSLSRLQKKRTEIEEFISSIEDNETRLIVRLRCINNMDWQQIGGELGMERTTVSKKFYNFLDKQGIIRRKNKLSHISRGNVIK